MDGGHKEGALGGDIVLCQTEGLLHDLRHHGRGRPVAQHFLHHLARIGHAVEHVPGNLRPKVWAHLRLLLPHLQRHYSQQMFLND